MGNKRYLIVTFNEEDGSRESGNIYYCQQILLSADRDELQFDESLFTAEITVSDDAVCTDDFTRQAVELGYVVEHAGRRFISYKTVFEDNEDN